MSVSCHTKGAIYRGGHSISNQSVLYLDSYLLLCAVITCNNNRRLWRLRTLSLSAVTVSSWLPTTADSCRAANLLSTAVNCVTISSGTDCPLRNRPTYIQYLTYFFHLTDELLYATTNYLLVSFTVLPAQRNFSFPVKDCPEIHCVPKKTFTRECSSVYWHSSGVENHLNIVH